MKKHLAPYLLVLGAAVSCGMTGHYAAQTQQFEDGIYADPRSETPVVAVSPDQGCYRRNVGRSKLCKFPRGGGLEAGKQVLGPVAAEAEGIAGGAELLQD